MQRLLFPQSLAALRHSLYTSCISAHVHFNQCEISRVYKCNPSRQTATLRFNEPPDSVKPVWTPAWNSVKIRLNCGSFLFHDTSQSIEVMIKVIGRNTCKNAKSILNLVTSDSGSSENPSTWTTDSMEPSRHRLSYPPSQVHRYLSSPWQRAAAALCKSYVARVWSTCRAMS